MLRIRRPSGYPIAMFEPPGIPISFLSKAAGVLGDSKRGLSGTAIVDAFLGYGDRWEVTVPHPEPAWEARNKREAVLDSLKAFSPTQQFIIIDELCEHKSLAVGAPSRETRKALRHELHTKFGKYKTETKAKELDLPLIEETRHWLQSYPGVLKVFNEAKTKYDLGKLERNVLDDLRLALELLLRAVLGNEKSLENQLAEIGGHFKARGVSKQLTNMLRSLLDYYSKYQNDYVKHDDAVNEEEIEFVFEISAAFMKHIVRVSA